MMFLGLGTGLGAAMIADGVALPMELAHLPYRKGKTFEDHVGVRGLERLGKRKWRQFVEEHHDWDTCLEPLADLLGLGSGVHAAAPRCANGSGACP